MRFEKLLSTPRQNFEFLQHVFSCEVQPDLNHAKIIIQQFGLKFGATNILKIANLAKYYVSQVLGQDINLGFRYVQDVLRFR